MATVVPELVEPIAEAGLPKVCVILCFGEDDVITGFDLVFASAQEAYEYFEELREKFRTGGVGVGRARRLAKRKKRAY